MELFAGGEQARVGAGAISHISKGYARCKLSVKSYVTKERAKVAGMAG